MVVLTDPDYPPHESDAGRAITHMQFAAFDRGVGSCLYTGFDETGMRAFLAVPDEYAVTAVVGFGKPAGPLRGRKERDPLGEIASRGTVGGPLDFDVVE